LSTNDPPRALSGIGPKTEDALKSAGIRSVGDILNWFPRSYELSIRVKPGEKIPLQSKVVLEGEVIGRSVRRGRKGSIFQVDFSYDSRQKPVRLLWFVFHSVGFKKRFYPGVRLRVSGKAQPSQKGAQCSAQIIHPTTELLLGESEASASNSILPVYREVAGIRQKVIRKMHAEVLDRIKDFKIEDPLPEELRRRYALPGLEELHFALHQPERFFEGEQARRNLFEGKSPYQKRLIFDHAFKTQIEVALVRSLRKTQRPAFQVNSSIGGSTLSRKLLDRLGFNLTKAQEDVLKEVKEDLAGPHPMHRLIQGDVGCGKTAIAFVALCDALIKEKQVALMAPTEVLAKQLFTKAYRLFEDLGYSVTLLTGALRSAEKNKAYAQIEKGESSIVVGTHALFQEKVQWSCLGMIIVDEQHRFGVSQRRLLREKGCGDEASPHVLMMSATPIPRSLTLVRYGDLDMSLVCEKPPGRQKIVTRVGREENRAKLKAFLVEKLQGLDRIFWVVPLVAPAEDEGDGTHELKNTEDFYKELSRDSVFKKAGIGILHGQMSPDEKEKALVSFRRGLTRILLSTTVIEVGVDIPEATIMVIENAERFGLAQLHQLRGRVGRGSEKSYCLLMTQVNRDSHAWRRLRLMEEHDDGFLLAEQDLKMRGPGDILGTHQSGFGEGPVSEYHDKTFEWIEEGQEAAYEVLEKDPKLQRKEHQVLRRNLEQTLNQKFENFTTG
jgi:ATP-dependent DNA helicase RecG